MPLAIQVPAMAPMSNRMIKAGVALRILVTMASSNACHLQRYKQTDSAVQTAEADNRDN